MIAIVTDIDGFLSLRLTAENQIEQEFLGVTARFGLLMVTDVAKDKGITRSITVVRHTP